MTVAPHVRPEIQVVLCCAQSHPSAVHIAHLRTVLRDEVDWKAIVDFAASHDVLPLLARNLSAICPEAVPAQVLASLRSKLVANAAHNILLMKENLHILRLLQAQGVGAVPWKGPTLAATAYGDVALRQFLDLDLLVRRQDVVKACDLLRNEGYALQHKLSRRQFAGHLRNHHALNMEREDGRVAIDLHWQIAPAFYNFRFDPETLWKRARSVALAGDWILTLAPEDSLLLVCTHASRHVWSTLQSVCDVAEMTAAHQSLDWQWVGQQARLHGWERMLHIGLLLAQTLLGAQLPAPVAERIERDRGALSLAAQVRMAYLTRSPVVTNAFSQSLFHLRMREHWTDRARYSIRVLSSPTEKEWGLLSMPAPLYFLYYPLRPLRLVGKHGRRLANRAHRALQGSTGL